MTSRGQSRRAASSAAAVIAPPVTSARPDRAKTLPIDKLIARRARQAAGLGQLELAAIVATSQQNVSAWENPTREHLPRVDHLRAAPREYRRFWVRELAALDGDVVVTGPTVVHACPAARLDAMLVELTDALRTQTARLRDDSTERIEAALKELREAQEVLVEAIAAEQLELQRRRG